MKKILAVLLVIGLWTSPTKSEDSDQSYSILLAQSYWAENIREIEPDHWYGLFKKDSTYVLEAVKVWQEVWRGLNGDREPDTTQTEVKVNREAKPIFLVRSVGGLKEGAVQTVSTHREYIAPGKLIWLPLRFANHLTALGNVTDEESREPGDLLIENYRIMLFQRTNLSAKRQEVVRFERVGYGALPTLLWAGDLDRDGKLDLLIDIATHYAGSHPALYLSSAATGDDLVGLVAELLIWGC